jgi:hypothetical protein
MTNHNISIACAAALTGKTRKTIETIAKGGGLRRTKRGYNAKQLLQLIYK